MLTSFEIKIVGDTVRLEKQGQMMFEDEISAFCLAAESDLVYVGLFDAPHYSFIAVTLSKPMRIILRHSLGVNLDISQVRAFY